MNQKTTLDRTSSGAVLTSLHEGNSVDAKRVDQSIGWIAGAGRKMDGTIHATAVACIYLSMPHVDGGHNCPNRAAKLVNAVAKHCRAVRLKALIGWFSAFSNVRFVKDDKSGIYTGKIVTPKSQMYKVADPQGANVKPFWTAEEANGDPAAFTDETLYKRIAAIIKAAAKDGALLSTKGKERLAALNKLVPAS